MKSEADAKVYPASITKLLNAYTALKYLRPDSVLTMTWDIRSIVPEDTSLAGIYVGNSLTTENVLRAMLVPSGSDAAHLMAVSAGWVIAGDPSLSAQQAENVFVEEMNRQAQSMGLINTHFTNCDGYPDYYHYTCMADLVTIATACLDTPLIRDTVRCAQTIFSCTDGRSQTVRTTNWLLRPGSAYYCEAARGMKTGTTDAAGACLLSAFEVNGRYVLIGVFQCANTNARYANALTLFNTFFSSQQPDTPPAPTDPTTTPTTAPTTPTTAPTTAPTTVPTTPTTTPTTATAPTTTPTTPSEPSLEGITAQNAFVYNCATGEYLYRKGAEDTPLYPASVTKLFTAYVALQYLELGLQVTPGDILDTVPASSSQIWLSRNSTYTVETLLYGMLLCSGNDAARVLSVEAGRIIAQDDTLSDADAMAVFMAEMNTQAAALGFVNSHFVTPDGYHHSDHYTCMADLVTIGSLCLENSTIRDITSTRSYTPPAPYQGITWENTNWLLNPNSPYHIDTAVGMKTGYTHPAGRCLLSLFDINGTYYLIGTFGCPDPETKYVAHFENTHILYRTYLQN
jgi:D-alanyl-D-alanine carboxypeptidase